MNAFLELSESALLRLIEMSDQESNAILNRLELSHYLHVTEVDAVATEMERLLSEGMSQHHLSYLLKAVLETRQHATSRTPKVDLVWTGIEHNSTTRETAIVVRDLFASARDSVLIAGFAVHRGREIFKVLTDRMAELPHLEVRMFLNVARPLRDTTVAEQLIGRFVHEFRRLHWPGARYPTIYYDPRALAMDGRKRTSLHAKCVVIDRTTAFVTSANFTEAAHERNIEVGTLVRDDTFSSALVSQFDTLVNTGAVQRLPLG